MENITNQTSQFSGPAGKRTKIIATLGPATTDIKTLTELIQSGVNVARLNFSHGTHEEHAEKKANYEKATKKAGVVPCVMQDLQGPKIRVSAASTPIEIKLGQTVTIGKDFTMDFDVSGSVKPGERVLIQDGLIQLTVKSIKEHNIECIANNGGVIKPRKGMNFPDTHFTERIMTDKDILDAKWGLKNDVDYIALSFVRTADDIMFLRKLIKKYNPKNFTEPKIVAKIELPSALENIEEIVKATDAVMIARGDLGVEIPAGLVPVVQKNIIKLCLDYGKTVIVATQMLESMVENPRPTRAEVSDVANAVLDQADCVMLSGETAYGKYPIEAVKIMSETIAATEASDFHLPEIDLLSPQEDQPTGSIGKFACELAYEVGAAAIVGATESGRTARYVARYKPGIPMYMLTEFEKTQKQMGMVWGTEGVLVQKFKNLHDIVTKSETILKKMGKIKKGDKIVCVVGNPLGGKVNLVEVRVVS